MEECIDRILEEIRPIIKRHVLSCMREGGRKSPIHPRQDVVLCKEYTGKSHALFGDFRQASYKSFKDEFLKNTARIRANRNLEFGFGWIFPIDKMELVRNKLDEYKIPYAIKTRRQLLERQRDAEVSASPPPSTEVSVTIPTLTTNSFGNRIDDEGFVYHKIDTQMVAVGIQDDESGERGLMSVLPLDDDNKKELKSKGIVYLTDDWMNKAPRKLRESLQKMIDQDVIEEDFESE